MVKNGPIFQKKSYFFFENYITKALISNLEDMAYEDPHIQLYHKFMQANEQLDLLEEEIDGEIKVGYLIDFVSKMFTPGFQVSKALEIASESSALKCRN